MKSNFLDIQIHQSSKPRRGIKIFIKLKVEYLDMNSIQTGSDNSDMDGGMEISTLDIKESSCSVNSPSFCIQSNKKQYSAQTIFYIQNIKLC